MRAATIARPAAVRDASESAQTSETMEEFREREFDCVGKEAESTAEFLETNGYSHIPGFRDF